MNIKNQPIARRGSSIVSDSSSNSSMEDKHHSLLGIFFIMLGSFSFSVMFLFVKLLEDVNTFTLVFYRALIEISIAVFELKRKGEPLLGAPGIRLYLVMRGAFGSIAVCAFFFGIQVLPLPDAVTLQFTMPPFAAAFAVCIVGEKWKVLDIVGAAVCLTGVAFIAHPTWLFGTTSDEDSSGDTSTFLSTLAVLVTTGGAALGGLAYVTVRKIGERASAVVMVLYFGVLSIPITMAGSALLVGEWQIWGRTIFSLKEIGLLFVIGVTSYAGQFFTNLGLQHETAATATLATSTQIVWTYIFELFLLHEAIDPWSMGGTGLILGYMLLVGVIKFVQERSYTPAKETELLPFTQHEEGALPKELEV